MLIYSILKKTIRENFNLFYLSTYAFFVLLLYWVVSFRQFFLNFPIFKLFSLSNLTFLDRIKYLLNNLLKMPDGILNLWSRKENFVIYQFEDLILSESTKILLEIFYQFHKIFSLLSFVILIYGLSLLIKSESNLPKFFNLEPIIIMIFFITMNLTLSPILGGYDFLILRERPDMLNQYYFIFIMIWYLIPHIFINTNKFNNIIFITRFAFTLFIALNISLGFKSVNDNKSYDQNIATNIEAPFIDKLKVVDFIAKTWSENSNKSNVSISYSIFTSDLKWFDRHTLEYEQYYTPSPYTEGRLLDLELYRKHNLTNIYFIDPNTNPDFFVTNIFDPLPTRKNGILKHVQIGRLRISY